MKIFLFSFLLLCIYSCGSHNSAVSKKLSGSDSLVINFKDISSGQIIHTVTTAEPNAIKKLSHFVAGKEMPEFKCSYNGDLLFYEKEKLVSDVSFNYNKDCQHFILTMDEKLVSTEMSNEAADFLQSLEKGNNWY